MNQEKITEIIYRAIENYNSSQPLENHLDKNKEEILFFRSGYTKQGKLDSMGLVYFLVSVEQELKKEIGNNFNLAIQNLLENKESELKNIESLVTYIAKKQLN